jgi:hypothetical protein
LKRLALTLVVLFLIPATANSETYKWTDEKGGVHFSDQAPAAAQAVPSSVPTSKPAARSFPLAQHGNLILSVPDSWKQEARETPGGLPPTIVFTPPQGDEFAVLITPLWSPKNEPGFNSPQVTKRLISTDLSKMLPGAVETKVPIEEFQGKYGTGYYFLVTDKTPGPRGFPYAVRAGVGVGDLMLSVTVLSRTKDSEAIRQTLEALRGAEQKKG